MIANRLLLITTKCQETNYHSRKQTRQSKCYRGRFSVTPAVLPRTVPCDARNNIFLSKIKLHREPSPVLPVAFPCPEASGRSPRGIFCCLIFVAGLKAPPYGYARIVKREYMGRYVRKFSPFFLAKLPQKEPKTARRGFAPAGATWGSAPSPRKLLKKFD